ncbi:MAG: tRNA-specific adenosine deaminase, partial [Streptomyces sp.]
MTDAVPPVPDPARDPAPAPAPDPVRDPWLAPMRHALGAAVRAPETGDVPVGAVVLGPDGAVLGTG